MIHWLGEEQCHLETQVGGKAAALSRLAAAHRVPPGFALAAVPATEHGALNHLSTHIASAYSSLAEQSGMAQPPVAVRSSAVDEDGGTASFAGQHDTYLNIRGIDSVLDAVRRCVLSASSNEALAYRQRHGLSVADVRMAVLVQQLVPSDVSAVAFSANPISGSRDEVMINSNWGLGESIVGGMTTPDSYVVRKADMRITQRDVALKKRMTVMTDSGTAETDIPGPQRLLPSLDDEGIVEIARLAAALERHVGHPVDVECAIAANTLYLLQCRPITTLG